MNNTKSYGDAAELIAAAEFAKNGYIVSRPLSDNASYDLLIDDGIRIKRIQVKGRSPSPRKGSIVVELYCNARSYTKRYKDTDFDALAVVCLESFQVALIDQTELFTGDTKYRTLTLRTSRPLNNQVSRVKMFEDYKVIPVNAQGVRPSC